MSEPLSVTENDFDSVVLANPKPTLVDFWGPSCGPCRMLVPVLNALAKIYDDKALIAKVDVSANQALAAKYEIAAIPALLLFKNGQVVARLAGVQKQSKLQELIDANL